jgi:glycosyltransferase involved in cell wall biosynthesis
MLNLAHGLVSQGCAVDLLVASTEGPNRDQVPSVRRLVEFGTSGVLRALPSLAKYIREFRPCVVISAMEHGNLVTLWAARLARVAVPIILTVHLDLPAHWAGEPLRGLARMLPWLVRRYYPRAQAIVAVSHGVGEALNRVVAIPPGRLHVIYNPLVTPELSRQASHPVSHPWLNTSEPPVFLGVGRLAPQKDFATLIRAFARLRRVVAAKLLILGEGPERVRLNTVIRDLHLEADVELTGFVPNPFAYMRRAAGVVLSSRYEGFGNVLVESMACGTPVVSTDCPSGPSEILEGGRYGPLVPVGDESRLADAMLSVLRHPIDSGELRARAVAFSVDLIADQYLTLIAGLQVQVPR